MKSLPRVADKYLFTGRDECLPSYLKLCGSSVESDKWLQVMFFYLASTPAKEFKNKKKIKLWEFGDSGETADQQDWSRPHRPPGFRVQGSGLNSARLVLRED